MSQNPFNRFKTNQGMHLPTANGSRGGGNQDVFDSGKVTNKNAQQQFANRAKPTEVAFPPHLYTPAGAQSLDLRRVVNLPTGNTDYLLYEFIAPPGCTTHFTAYGIFNDGDDGANFNFRPLVDGSRVFQYHGDPTQNFKIYLGLGPDLSNVSLIPCQLSLNPGQKLQWLITNVSGVDTSMGVRMTGYLDTSLRRETARFGG